MISPEANKLIRARELDKDRQNAVRNQSYERMLEDLEHDRDTWKLIAIWAMAFALIAPAYKIWEIAGPIVLEMLK